MARGGKGADRTERDAATADRYSCGMIETEKFRCSGNATCMKLVRLLGRERWAAPVKV